MHENSFVNSSATNMSTRKNIHNEKEEKNSNICIYMFI